MTKGFPFLALDSAGERTILCDHPVKMFDDTIKPRSTKMTKTTLSSDELSRYVSLRVRNPAAADRYWARCLGQDAAMDDETVEKLKAFLQSKLSSEDHAAACSMMDGGGAAMEPEAPRTAADAAGFYQRYPDAARIRLDNSGIPVPRRAASYSAAGAKSFAERFPDLMKVRLA